ncbi:hypothetical protein [Microvirga rosea]|uniref:hypothetical protein n=1 Tax=Microvirga rosea TaxID=2715425 RepID=UPI001D0AD35F|nr:hypothetical protein [Microvirga rosea]MCB8822409.1 hypothetical protein [Microvirga rosea]
MGFGAAEPKRKKAAVASGPKFREETPKKGSDMTTPSPYRTAQYKVHRTICKRKITRSYAFGACQPGFSLAACIESKSSDASGPRRNGGAVVDRALVVCALAAEYALGKSEA